MEAAGALSFITKKQKRLSLPAVFVSWLRPLHPRRTATREAGIPRLRWLVLAASVSLRTQIGIRQCKKALWATGHQGTSDIANPFSPKQPDFINSSMSTPPFTLTTRRQILQNSSRVLVRYVFAVYF